MTLPSMARLCLLAAGGGATRVRTTDGAVRAAHAADLTAACAVADHLPEVGVVAGPPVRVAKASTSPRSWRSVGARRRPRQLTGRIRRPTRPRQLPRPRQRPPAASPATALRDRPSISLIADPVALDAAIVFARAGLPVGALAGSPMAAPAQAPPPVTPDDLGAALALANAAALAACAAVQAAAPARPSSMSPHRGGLAGASRRRRRSVRPRRRSARRRAGLPLACDLLTSGSPEPDWQASTQNCSPAQRPLRPQRRASRRRPVRRRRPVQPRAARHGCRGVLGRRQDRRRYRSRRRDDRPRDDRQGRHRRQLLERAPHATAHEGRLAPAPPRPHAMGCVGSPAAGKPHTTRLPSWCVASSPHDPHSSPGTRRHRVARMTESNSGGKEHNVSQRPYNTRYRSSRTCPRPTGTTGNGRCATG